MSDGPLDGLDVPLEDAIAAIVGSGYSALVSCVPGRLAYFEDEGPDQKYILERASQDSYAPDP